MNGVFGDIGGFEMFDEKEMEREVWRISAAAAQMEEREGDARVLDWDGVWAMNHCEAPVAAWAEHSLHDELNGIVWITPQDASYVMRFTGLIDHSRYQEGKSIGCDYVRYWSKKPTAAQMAETPWARWNGEPIYPDGM